MKAVTRMDRRAVLKMAAAGTLGMLPCPAISQSKQLNMITERSNAGTRAALSEIASSFQKETGISVAINNMDHEAHKTAIRNYLVASPPDLCFWFSGARMKAFVKRGLFEDISDLVAREKYLDVLGTSAEGVTVNGRQYGLPTSGIYWGFYHRKDVLADLGLVAPQTFDDLRNFGVKAKSAGLTPFAIGTKELWPAACWFDSLNLRINGLDKHMALMNGDISYLDPMLQPVFDRWEELIKSGLFLPNETSYSWQQAAAFMVQKKAAMFHIGQFVQGVFPAEDREQIAVSAFPEIVPGVGPFDEVSYNSVHIPSGSKNKEMARDFLAYLYRPENLTAILKPEGAISPRLDAPTSDTPLMRSVIQSMRPLKGSSQFYDRDTDPDMAQVGLNGFQEFMAAPDRRTAILERMEAARKRIFKA